MSGWTLERRRKHSEAIRKWKPWERSTGPKSEEGKGRVSLNAFKHGMRSAEIREIEAVLAEQARARAGCEVCIDPS